MSLCLVAFGLCSHLKSTDTLITAALVLRFMQGASSALIQTTCYSIAINDFPSEKDAMIGYIEAFTGIGLVLGPIIGSVIYSNLGFENTFYFCGVFIGLFAIFITFFA